MRRSTATNEVRTRVDGVGDDNVHRRVGPTSIAHELSVALESWMIDTYDLTPVRLFRSTHTKVSVSIASPRTAVPNIDEIIH